MITATRHGEPEPPRATEESRLDAAALVLGYVEARAQGKDTPADSVSLAQKLLGVEKELAATRVELTEAEQRAAELSRTVDTLKALNERLQETIRSLEIGFRRHISEQISPDQLRLALAADPGAPSTPSVLGTPEAEGDGASPPSAQPPTMEEAGDGSPAPASSTEQAVAEIPSGSDPSNPKQKNRNNHGRRRIGILPKVIIETVPPDVLLKGLDSFERVGAEDSSLIGYRRGGHIELVLRRPKYVLRGSSSAAAGMLQEEPEEEPARGPDGVPTAAPASAGAPDDAVVVLEHDALMIPADTGFKLSPFVDGAIVRFAPDAAGAVSEDGPVWIAPLPERPIDRSLADPSLLAHVLVHKLDYHTPYYRQEVGSIRYGFRLNRATMARWQFECGGIAMRIADAMWNDALTRPWFAMDATGTAIWAKEQYRYAHVFVLVAPGDGVMFRYTPKYDGPTVVQLFGGYQGTVVSDASANHNRLFGPGKAREAGCWSHARKRFVKAFRGGESKEAAFALQTIQALFRIEEEVALCSPDERLAIRQCRSAPLIDALFTWVEQARAVVPEHALLRAGLVYLHNQRLHNQRLHNQRLHNQRLHNQRDALCEFLSNGEIPIHNNASERALRRVVKGRQNWLFHGSDEHAVRACAITSLIASCEMHGLDPEFYLQEVLTVAPSYPLSRILDLSPKNWVATRQRLIAEGRLKYLDLGRITGSRLVFRDR